MQNYTLGGLKKILVAASHFYDIQDYFLCLTETNIAAIDGKPGKNKILKEIISSTLTEICLRQDLIEEGAKIILVSMSMIEVRPRYFWHGSGFVNGEHIFTFFYFSDLDMGMVAVATTKDGNNIFARISIKSISFENPVEAYSKN